MVSPKIVILDEVGAVVNRTLLKEIGDAILKMNRERRVINICFSIHYIISQ